MNTSESPQSPNVPHNPESVVDDAAARRVADLAIIAAVDARQRDRELPEGSQSVLDLIDPAVVLPRTQG